MNIERTKASYVFDGVTIDFLPDNIAEMIQALLKTEHIYTSAIREIVTKLEILNDEFKYTTDHKPIHHIETRVKTPKSIMEKLIRKGYELSIESACKNLNDIAGIRVICSYIDDIYKIADLLTSQDDVELIQTNDYIKNPKPNGYRSLHLIVTVPVFLSNRTERVKAEVQIRTIAMDFWASLEHELAYKINDKDLKDISEELKACADASADIDIRMQKLYNRVKKQGEY